MKSLAQFLRTAPRGSQAALARTLDVSDSTVLRWAEGKIRIDRRTAERITAAMEIEREVQNYILELRKRRKKNAHAS